MSTVAAGGPRRRPLGKTLMGRPVLGATNEMLVAGLAEQRLFTRCMNRWMTTSSKAGTLLGDRVNVAAQLNTRLSDTAKRRALQDLYDDAVPTSEPTVQRWHPSNYDGQEVKHPRHL